MFANQFSLSGAAGAGADRRTYTESPHCLLRNCPLITPYFFMIYLNKCIDSNHNWVSSPGYLISDSRSKIFAFYLRSSLFHKREAICCDHMPKRFPKHEGMMVWGGEANVGRALFFPYAVFC